MSQPRVANITSADPSQLAGIKYQETHKRCPPNVVAIEYRLSEKCGKLPSPELAAPLVDESETHVYQAIAVTQHHQITWPKRDPALRACHPLPVNHQRRTALRRRPNKRLSEEATHSTTMTRSINHDLTTETEKDSVDEYAPIKLDLKKGRLTATRPTVEFRSVMKFIVCAGRRLEIRQDFEEVECMRCTICINIC